MKKAIMLLLSVLCTAATTLAYDFQSGDLYYNITGDNTVEVTYRKWNSSTNYQGLTTATIPATVTNNGTTYSVTGIGNLAFSDCSSLTSVTISNSVTNIGNGAFEGCSSLTSIVVESGNTMYDSRENCNAIIETATNTLIAGCQSTIIPNSVTGIGDWAFGYCSSLTSITLPNSVTSIGYWAFSYCSSLTSITLPNSVTYIGEGAFQHCSSLTSITIPNSVTGIGEYAFLSCLKLRDIYCYPATPPTAKTNPFANYNAYLHVPCESLDAYNMDAVFGSFEYVECIGSEEVTSPGNSVTVIPGNKDATFTWPSHAAADTYSLVITKDGVVFCTLVFNTNGQLMSIAFAPSKNRQNTPASKAAEAAANGWRFTVTGLNGGSTYAYALTTRDAANTVLETYTGDFTTLSDDMLDGIRDVAGEDAAQSVRKIFRDGQVVILRGDKTYSILGEQR